MTQARDPISKPRCAQLAAIVCVLGSALGGCLSEAHVFASEDAGTSDGNPFGNAGQQGIQRAADSCANPADLSRCFNPFYPDGGPAGPMTAPLVQAAPPSVLVDREECSDTPSEILTGIDEIYGLAVTPTKLYAGTYEGVFVTGRDGGAGDLVVDQYAPRILADEHNLFWSSGSLDLNVQTEDGTSSIFLPTHGSIEGVSQDDDSIYAISDGYLVSVSKQTKAVSTLVDGTTTTPLHWSGTAVDASFVYFVSYPTNTNPVLERIGKDGTGREQLAANISVPMAPVTLLVDASYVYIAGFTTVSRVPVAGGTPELLPLDVEFYGQDLPLAQDDSCLYYASDRRLICVSKADGSHQLVLSLEEGSIRSLAKSGSDLYFGVYVDSPAFDKKSWVGRVLCQP